MSPRLLVVSNGHGEDLIAATIAQHLAGASITAYPLVGLGNAYPPDIPRLEPRRAFPSGGYAFHRAGKSLVADLRAGFARFWLAQRRTLAAQRGRFDLVVAVGDVYCLVMASRARRPAVLVATADSVRIAPYGRALRWLLRQRARRVFTRDAPTAAFLTGHGIDAAYLGNPMMDCLTGEEPDFALPADAPVVTLLPGSRQEATTNAALLAAAAAAVARARPEVRFLLSLAPSVRAEAMAAALATAAHAVLIAGDRAPLAPGQEAAARPTRLILTRTFAAAVRRGDVVVGLAGTANEQAAGLGKPVVAFPGPGPQFTGGFLRTQHRLLGEALVPTASPAEAARAVLRLLNDPEERRRCGLEGMARMGTPGASERIARALAELLQEPTGAPAAAMVTAARRPRT